MSKIIKSYNLYENVQNGTIKAGTELDVWYKDCFKTRIKFDGFDFVWETGTFTSGMLFDLSTEFEIVEKKPILQRVIWNDKSSFANCEMTMKGVTEMLMSRSEQLKKTLNDVVDLLKYMENKDE